MAHNSSQTDQSLQLIFWCKQYKTHLKESLRRMVQFCSVSDKKIIKPHIVSILTLLEVTFHDADLSEIRLKLINELHPLPLRWGFSSRWEPRMMEIIEATSYHNEKNSYLNDLADYYLVSGQTSKALSIAGQVLADHEISINQAVSAARIQFVGYRTQGEPENADLIHQEIGNRFGLFTQPDELSEDLLTAWLKFHQTELELLREKGRIDEALSLANQLIALSERQPQSTLILAAELRVHRSTLLWVRARYVEAIKDLKLAVDLYEQEEDHFNSQSLKSNIGLVYWTMGELERAEENLIEAIQFYQRCGADHLMTYDIGNLGLVYLARGELEKAKSQTLDHIRHAEKIGFNSEAFRGHNNLGDIMFYFGEFEQAIAEHEEIDKYFSKRGSRENYGLGKVWVACSRAKLGYVDEAVAELKVILDWCSANHSGVLQALTHRALAFCLPENEREYHLQKNIRMAREQGRQLEEAAGLLMLAHVLKDQVLRKETWNSGVKILERIGATSWLNGKSIDDPPFIAMLI